MKSEEIIFLNLLGIGFKRYSYIKQNFGSITNIPSSYYEEVSRILKIDKEILEKSGKGLIEDKVKNLLKDNQKFGIGVVTIEDDVYPLRLKDLPDRPILLYYKGDIKILNSSVSCAIVGTRRNDELGKVYTKNLVDMLVSNSVLVVSGLARGIDIIAHRRVIERRGQTVAVLANGLDQVYPPEHKKEFLEISENGCLVSEYPIGVRPLKRNFFIRNRIVSGLSDVVVVVQAPEKSGAMITAKYALKQKRTLFAIPGNIENPLHRGCNILMREGAIPLIDYKDVLEELGYKSVQTNLFHTGDHSLSEEEKFIYSLITKNVTIDEISEITGMPVSSVYPILLSLEVKGLILQNVGGTFSRVIS
ncbi:MAG: DNA-processing protein DprA [Spirochaetia bacterium]|nr:DNA-processing protein DprA [Spirochaetota bacterium]MCX8096209.1 DNA-processing protein DprA [Spirochaetota bacterium]MDW8112925.1 DNA-processing protein DprA [Spirochaetia bacterium]